ncbi:TetR family transcriptional regulator [Phyllobacterium myrsinacearum]|uniref:AcrR family transcriptional regulator n=1 Tax=Phyllobacterium myrsinacearum TaxID=28101 RepID=A0A839ENC4_9HYPH|nr:AcrR family transcriptional regulator [Phyllobacterium myrsinacearum]
MARPLSEDKRNAILAAATEIIAVVGTGASTAKIARNAGVAEGSLFTYFANKDELLNQLYLDIKSDLHAAIVAGYPGGAGLKVRCEHLWNHSLDWAAANPAKRKTMRQLGISNRVTEQSKKAGAEAFRDIAAMMEEGFTTGVLRSQPTGFIGGIMESLSEMTLDFIARDGKNASAYKKSGFDAFWGAIAAQ